MYLHIRAYATHRQCILAKTRFGAFFFVTLIMIFHQCRRRRLARGFAELRLAAAL